MRRFKRAEEFRIGLQEIAGEADILVTMRDLSNLADIYLEAVLRIVWQEWARTIWASGEPRGPWIPDYRARQTGRNGARFCL